MKKRLYSILLFIACFSIFCGCKKQALPIPPYPLNAIAVTAAMEEAGLSWTITEAASWMEEHAVYTLCDEDGKMAAAVSSAVQDGSRVLYISFMPHHGALFHPLPEEEWECAFVFGTLLYGGFDGKHQVYDTFSFDYVAENTVQEVREKKPGTASGHEEVIWWESILNGVTCKAGVGRPDRSIPPSYLFTLSFVPADVVPQ